MSDEIKLTRNIRAMILREFPEVYIQRVSDKFLSGLPDIRLLAYGFSADIEVKTMCKGSRVSAIQEKVHERIRKAGGVVCVVRSLPEARAFMTAFVSDAQRKDWTLKDARGKTKTIC